MNTHPSTQNLYVERGKKKAEGTLKNPAQPSHA
jgi:hypothetical protein